MELSDNVSEDQKRVQFMLLFNLRDINSAPPAPPPATQRPVTRSQRLVSLSRCPAIPLSSPAGRVVIEHAKKAVTPQYLKERQDRIEKFCQTSPRDELAPRSARICMHTFKPPQDYDCDRPFKFPRRQFSAKRKLETVNYYNSLLERQCRPLSVRLTRISDKQIKRMMRNCNRKTVDDTIDLCESEEDENNNNSRAAIQVKPVKKRNRNLCKLTK